MGDNFIDIEEKNENILGENIISEAKEENVMSLDELVINLFTSEKFVKGILKARENILSQSRSGKRGYYTFSYPGIGWVQYDHNSIQSVYKLASMRPKVFLYDSFMNKNKNPRQRLHLLAALIIQTGDYYIKLYSGIEKAREFSRDNRLVYITFENPFRGIIKTQKDFKKYTGEELLNLYNIGISKKFNGIF